MPYAIAIRKNSTGERRIAHISLDWYKYGGPTDPDDDGDLFWWTEGNMGCDCNRELYFMEAGGEDADDHEPECGDERYSVLWAELPDGSVILIDGRDHEKPEGSGG